MTIKKTPLITIFLSMLVLFFIACGSKSDVSKTGETTQPVRQAVVQTTSAEKALPTNDQALSDVLTDGQIFTFEQFTFTIPKDWKGDKKTQVWCPATENLDIPLPPVNLFCGSMPVMPGTTIDARIKTHIGTEPLQKIGITVCSYKGFVYLWEFNSYKHMGLFLEEKVGGGISIINFFNCQAPTASFEAYAKTFKQIIGSVKCK